MTQSTGLFLAPEISSKILFIGLSASNYTIIGSVIASILYIYTNNIPVSLAGNFLSHTAILLILYKSIHKIWLRQDHPGYRFGVAVGNKQVDKQH